ncbi:MAG: FIG00816212: Putative membrane protein, partial [uncultured Acidimicrobiales bacterium]
EAGRRPLAPAHARAGPRHPLRHGGVRALLGGHRQDPRHRSVPGRADGRRRAVDHGQRGGGLPALGPVPVHPPEPGVLHPGRLRRAPDPPRPEPPGRAGQGADRAGPRGRVPHPGGHRVPRAGAGGGAHRAHRRRHRRRPEPGGGAGHRRARGRQGAGNRFWVRRPSRV